MLPFIKIFGFTVPMYSLCIEVGVFFAVLVLFYDCKQKNVLWNDAVIIGVTGIVIGFAGAKLLYVITAYSPHEIGKIIFEGRLEYISNGGFVFYGGFIFGIIGALIGARISKSKLMVYENVLVKLIPLVHAFGRVGCFCAGCCYGRPIRTGFGVVYTNPASDAPCGIKLLPVQLYEATFNMLLFAIMIFIDKKKPSNKILLPVYLIGYSIERFIIEYFRYDEIRGRFLCLTTSQWISAGLFVVGILVIFVRRKLQQICGFDKLYAILNGRNKQGKNVL